MISGCGGAGRSGTALSAGLALPLALIGVATFVALLSTGQAALERFYHGSEIPWIGILLAQLTDAYSYSIFVPALLLLARRMPFRSRQIPLYLLVTLGAALAKEAIVVVVADQFRPGVFSLRTILAEDYCSEVLTFCALVAVSHLIVRARAPVGNAPQAEARPDTTESAPRAERRLSPSHIEWVQAEGNYVLLHTDGGRTLLRRTLAGVADELGGALVRVHRGAAVNVSRIVRIERSRAGSQLVLRSGTRVRVGRTHLAEVRRRIEDRTGE